MTKTLLRFTDGRRRVLFAALCSGLVAFGAFFDSGLSREMWTEYFGWSLFCVIATLLIGFRFWRRSSGAVISPEHGTFIGLKVGIFASLVIGSILIMAGDILNGLGFLGRDFPEYARFSVTFILGNITFFLGIFAALILTLTPFFMIFGAVLGDRVPDDVLQRRFPASSRYRIAGACIGILMCYCLWMLVTLCAMGLGVEGLFATMSVINEDLRMTPSQPWLAFAGKLIEQTWMTGLVLLALALGAVIFGFKRGMNRRTWMRLFAILGGVTPLFIYILGAAFDGWALQLSQGFGILVWAGIVIGVPIGLFAGHIIGSHFETRAWTDQLEREAKDAG